MAVVIFLLVIHHNFLSLSDFLRRELSGMLGFILILKNIYLFLRFGEKTPALVRQNLPRGLGVWEGEVNEVIGMAEGTKGKCRLL